MVFFVCERCNCIDSTLAPGYSGNFICTECRTGEWHYLFDKKEYDPKVNKEMLNRPNPTTTDGSEVSMG